MIIVTTHCHHDKNYQQTPISEKKNAKNTKSICRRSLTIMIPLVYFSHTTSITSSTIATTTPDLLLDA